MRVAFVFVAVMAVCGDAWAGPRPWTAAGREARQALRVTPRNDATNELECANCADVEHTVVGVGPIKGFEKLTRDQKSVASFLGLPFAKLPDRFEPSSGLEDEWTETRDARIRAPACPQGKFYPEDVDGEGPGSPNGDEFSRAYTFGDVPKERDMLANQNATRNVEDCLTLDVYTPLKTLNEVKAGGTPRLPVLFWVHGGAFVRGSSISARPDFLLDQADVVIVAPQYRLGPLGFLVAGGREGGKGNQALWDQKLALEWTKKNIAQFGGDPNNIVVGGVSAGGATSGLLYVSPRTREDMQAAILCSGTAVSPWTIDYNPRAATKDIAKLAGCEKEVDELVLAEEAKNGTYEDRMNKEDDLKRCLKDLEVEPLVEAVFQYAMTEKFHGRVGMGGTIPVVDGEGGFLPQAPHLLMAEQDFKGRPLLVGVTRDEGVYLFVQVHYFYMEPRNLLGDTELHRSGMGNVLLRFAGVEDHLHVLGHAVEQLYWTDDQLGDYVRMEDGMIDFTGAGFFKGPAREMALLNNKHNGTSWLYTFDYAGVQVRNEARDNSSKPRANHGHDQVFLFPARRVDYEYFDEDWKVVDKFTHMMANFITRRDPRDPSTNGQEQLIHGQRWEPLDGIDGAYMSIGSNWERRTHWSSEFHATNSPAARAAPVSAAALFAAIAAVLGTALAR